ncbi:GGACT domain-containing protein [Balamuthia mandrillaris]
MKKKEKTEDEEEEIWYFAYGSNLNPKVLRRRGLCPKETRCGYLRGWKLSFMHMGFPLREPAFATVLPADAGQAVHGVLYLLSSRDWRRLLATEGTYIPVQVTVTLYKNKKTIEEAETEENGEKTEQLVTAQTLTSATGTLFSSDIYCSSHYPSKRYLNLIIEGARLFSLQEEYIEEVLENQPTYEPSFLGSICFLFMALWLGCIILLPLVVMSRLDVKTPSFFLRAAELIKRSLWLLHFNLYLRWIRN